MSKITIRQTKSTIGQPESVRRIMQGLGLGKMNASKTHKDNNCIRGMVNKVSHLVSYELVTK